ncbi:MAG: rhomboid family intramembrane serine protease [Candidatus Izimaplasma sp.]|nr:rhomboid family intramembrane serine protease [Candidatus Izimaplasma bacterium]
MSIFTEYGSLQTFFKRAPITAILLISNSLLFLITLVFNGTNLYITSDTLIKLGGIESSLVYSGQYYRLLSGMFLHASIEHFFGNMIIGIYALGGSLERMVGSVKYSIIYFFGGLFASYLVIIFNPNTLTVGASGAIFAALGALFFVSMFKKELISESDRKTIIILFALQILFTFIGQNISIVGHLGGALGGFILGFLLIKGNTFKIVN